MAVPWQVMLQSEQARLEECVCSTLNYGTLGEPLSLFSWEERRKTGRKKEM